MRKQSVVVIGGMPSFGKSTFCNRLLLNGSFSARFMFDHQPGEFDRSQGEYAHRLSLPAAKSQYGLDSGLVRGWVAFDPHEMFSGRMEEAFDFFCEWTWTMAGKIPGEKIVVIDDAYQFCTTHKIPDMLKQLVQSGSKRNITLVINTQQPQQLNEVVKGGMSEIVLFRLMNPKALEFAKYYGFDPDEIANLPRLAFVARNHEDGGELRHTIEV